MPRVEPLPLERLEAHLRASGARYTSLERVVYPAREGRGALLKAHVIDYYVRVAPWAFPHLAGRPLVFRRYPDGVRSDPFYTKDWGNDRLPDGVDALAVWSESREEPMRYAVLAREDALPWVAQTSAVEVHPWLSRVGDDPASCATAEGMASPACGLDRPDVLAFDVDPYVRAARTGAKGREAGGEPGLAPEDWARAVEAAHELADVLRALRAPAFLKTSGKRGLHIYVPLVPDRPYDEVRAVARTICAHVAARRPDLATLSYDLKQRKGRVFLDWNQNVRGKTLAAPYSLRPTDEATVSTPLEWDELDEADPAAFHVASVPARLAERGDPWADFEEKRVRVERLAGM